jgi:2-(1,2-epoxy-1,2-dihydrophenyl)acetyl-CoA isomerase
MDHDAGAGIPAFEEIEGSVDDDGVATLTLNRPAARNALTSRMMGEIRAALSAWTGQPRVRALLLTAAGAAFCSGQDLKNRAPMGADIAQLLMDDYYPTVDALRKARFPVVVAVNGTVAGAGFALVMAGDIVLAARSAQFIQAFSRIGLIPDLGSTYTLPRAMGRSRALRMMLTGDAVTADQAAQWGLVSECVDDEELMPAARSLAKRLARGPTRALVATRAMVDEGERNDFRTQFRRELEVQKSLRESRDAREGVAAFLEKRRPVFTGE